jgi:hypothetical protein
MYSLGSFSPQNIHEVSPEQHGLSGVSYYDYHWIFLFFFCVDGSMQVTTSRKMMWCSFTTSTRRCVRDVEPIPRTTPTVSVALFHLPMVSGSRDCGKRWRTRLRSLDLTRARLCACLKTPPLDWPTLELHAMWIVFCNAFIWPGMSWFSCPWLFFVRSWYQCREYCMCHFNMCRSVIYWEITIGVLRWLQELNILRSNIYHYVWIYQLP